MCVFGGTTIIRIIFIVCGYKFRFWERLSALSASTTGGSQNVWSVNYVSKRKNKQKRLYKVSDVYMSEVAVSSSFWPSHSEEMKTFTKLY